MTSESSKDEGAFLQEILNKLTCWVFFIIIYLPYSHCSPKNKSGQNNYHLKKPEHSTAANTASHRMTRIH